MQDKKGKGKAIEKEDEADPKDGMLGIEVLLQLLGRSICQRSGSFLESTLNLIEVRWDTSDCYRPHNLSVRSYVLASMKSVH